MCSPSITAAARASHPIRLEKVTLSNLIGILYY